MAENFMQKAGTFAQDAAIDTAADGAINSVIDGVASHVPGGGMVDGMLKTGVDLAANNAINAEIGRIEGGFGGHHTTPQASEPSTVDDEAADSSSDGDASS